MTREELIEVLDQLDIPPTDDEGIATVIVPDEQLRTEHGLDTSYYRLGLAQEGGSMHADSRICAPDNVRMQKVLKNIDVPYRMFSSAITLFANSLREYHGTDERRKNLKYFPASVLTFWSGFETLVRFLSEKFVLTVKDVSRPVADFLLETDQFVTPSGDIRERTQYHPVLDRLSVFLSHAYGLKVDKGSKAWQSLSTAKDLRDYYSHLDVRNSRSLRASEVLGFMESILVSLVWASCQIQKTIYLELYEVYFLWKVLFDAWEDGPDYVEEPFAKSFPDSDWLMFHCNFRNVDEQRYPNSKQQMEQLGI